MGTSSYDGRHRAFPGWMNQRTVWTLALSVLGILLAVSNWRLIRENERLGATAQFYASLRHTPVGVALPDLQGKDLNGRDLKISSKGVNQKTLLLVFSPTCPHCKRIWPVWQDLAGSAAGTRVVFVNAGGPLPPDFSRIYSFDSADVMAETSPESILQYSLLETPITILMSADGQSERVWTGEIAASKIPEIEAQIKGPTRAVGAVR
jgi:thiol-disulfide isomerase/thioredoxin